MVAPKITHKVSLDVVGNPKTEKGISPMQERFALLYCTRDDLNQTECALEAGYAPDYAYSTASKLLNGKDYPRVTQRIREIKEELAKKYEVTFENHVMMLAKIRDDAWRAGAYAPAVSAEKARGQVAGLYIDRKEILHGKIDQMSKEELQREIQKLVKDNPGLRAIAATTFTLEGDFTVDEEEENEQEAGTESVETPEGEHSEGDPLEQN